MKKVKLNIDIMSDKKDYISLMLGGGVEIVGELLDSQSLHPVFHEPCFFLSRPMQIVIRFTNQADERLNYQIQLIPWFFGASEQTRESVPIRRCAVVAEVLNQQIHEGVLRSYKQIVDPAPVIVIPNFR
jgi:hypothetical protein